MTRLQGKQFQELKPLLMMVSYLISSHGNIKVFMKYKPNKGNPKARFTHWLNEQELIRFKSSEYFKTHSPISVG